MPKGLFINLLNVNVNGKANYHQHVYVATEFLKFVSNCLKSFMKPIKINENFLHHDRGI